MAVVIMKKGKEVWEILVPDAPEEQAKSWALEHANGSTHLPKWVGARVLPSNALKTKGEWEVAEVRDDMEFSNHAHNMPVGQDEAFKANLRNAIETDPEGIREILREILSEMETPLEDPKKRVR